MSATDELRRLLDERGVKWSDASDDDIQHTTWNTGSCWFSEFNDGWTGWGMSMGGTPEQAIAATLWSKPDEIELTQTYDAGFSNGVMAVFQQLEGIEDYEELQCFIAEYWGEGEGYDEP